MITQTWQRVRSLARHKLLVVTHEDQIKLARQSLPTLERSQFLAEPFAKNTAASIAWAAFWIASENPNAIMAVLPADHAIPDRRKFNADLKLAIQAAEKDSLCTIGIRPHFAATGYGYLQRGDIVRHIGDRAVFRVESFIEKPNAQKAQTLFLSGKHFWNSGIFVWKVSRILNALQTHMPELYLAFQRIAAARGTKSLASVLRREYRKLAAISIDYGVMEKAPDVLMIESSFRWSDVGSWKALFDLMKTASQENVSLFPNRGDFFPIESSDCLAFSEEAHCIAAIGVEGLVIVRTADATLVARKDRAEDVKKLVELLQRRKKKLL